MHKVTAVIPVKGVSERVKDKNLRELDGETLLERKIRILKECKLVEKIVVNTDSERIINIARDKGVAYVKRDSYFTEQATPLNEVIRNVIENTPGEHIMWSQVTSPLLTSKTTDKAIEKYFEKIKEGYDSLASVEKLICYLWKDNKPVNYSLGSHPRSQDLDPYYNMTFGILIIERELAIANNYYVGSKPYLFEVSAEEAIDIDTEEDLFIA